MEVEFELISLSIEFLEEYADGKLIEARENKKQKNNSFKTIFIFNEVVSMQEIEYHFRFPIWNDITLQLLNASKLP